MRPFHVNNSSYHGQPRAPNTFQPRAQAPSYQQQGWGSGCTGSYYGNHGNTGHRNGSDSQYTNSMNNNGYVPHQKEPEMNRTGNSQSGKPYHHGSMGMYNPRDRYQVEHVVTKSFQNGNVNRNTTAPWNNGQNYNKQPTYTQSYDNPLNGSYSNNTRGYGSNSFIDGGNNSQQSYFNNSELWQNQTYQPNSTPGDTNYSTMNESFPTHYNKPNFNRGKPGRGRGFHPQNHHQNTGGGQKKQKVDKRELPENNKFFCDSCDRGFPTEEKYTTHINEHQQCSYEGCHYIAAPKLVQIHQRLQHTNGMAKKIWSLESAEDIKKWKEERKKNFPTADNIARKNNLIEERKARGEVLETKYFGKMKGKNYNKQTICSHDNQDNTEDKEEKRNGRKRRRNRRKKFGQWTTEENEGTETKIPKLDPTNNTEEQVNKSEETSQSNGTDLPTEKRLSNSSEVKEICSNMQGEASHEETNKEEKCRHQNRNKKQQRKNGGKGRNQDPKINKSKSHPPTLLEKLLAKDIRHERNVILQCVHYIVKKNFFGIGQSTSDTLTIAETSTLDGQTSTTTELSMSDELVSSKTKPSIFEGQTSTVTESSMSDRQTSTSTDIPSSDEHLMEKERSMSEGPISTKIEPSLTNGQSPSETIQTKPEI